MLNSNAHEMINFSEIPTPSPGLKKETFEAEVASRFGLVPNFFRTASTAPGLIEELWGFAKSAYLDNPFPSLFKERLFVHLSRFCEVRYCIARHVGFLVGEGNPAGDPLAKPNTIMQVVDLLSRPTPQNPEVLASLKRLATGPLDIPESGTTEEWDVFVAATVIFLEPSYAAPAKHALTQALGVANVELLIAYLAFIRTAHYWTLTHPELEFEEDIDALLKTNEELTKLLLDDTDATRQKVGSVLYEELLLLRQERDDRAALRLALAERELAQRHQQLLINELNHRVKNTLAIVQSLAAQTLGDAPIELRNAFSERLVALAETHDLLTANNWESTTLNAILRRTLNMLTTEALNRYSLVGPEIQLEPKQALSFAMAAHELATNAAKYGALSNKNGIIEVSWSVVNSSSGQNLEFTWKEHGGPTVTEPTRFGFGSRLVKRGLAAELRGTAEMRFEPDGLMCFVTAPLRTPEAIRVAC